MSMTIVWQTGFEAAHRLPQAPEGHKCHRVHGHSFRCELHLTGDVDPTFGWVHDFDALEVAFQPYWQQLDHHLLNEVEGLSNPTSENIALWIWERLKPVLPQLSAVVIHETCTSRVIYTGPGRDSA
ncbi:MAG: 6-carboxytetrahydropterin synthase QueD [Myxococcota bacterium]